MRSFLRNISRVQIIAETAARKLCAENEAAAFVVQHFGAEVCGVQLANVFGEMIEGVNCIAVGVPVFHCGQHSGLLLAVAPDE